MKRLIPLVAALALPMAAHAAPPYCPHAGAVAMLTNGQMYSDRLDTIRYGRPVSTIDMQAATRDVYSQCHSGDAVTLERGTLMVQVCDLSTVQQVGANVLCRLK